jgi:hypothetical protein
MSAQVRLDAAIVAASRFLGQPRHRLSVNRYRALCVGCRHRHRGSSRFEVGGAAPQTAVILSWPRLQFWAAELRRAFGRR